jgi:hypothetical protein
VVTIMMMGIVLTLIGAIMTNYMPVWAKSKEISHMDEVVTSMTELKSDMDAVILREDQGALVTTRMQLVLRVMQELLYLTVSEAGSLPPICRNHAVGQCPFKC